MRPRPFFGGPLAGNVTETIESRRRDRHTPRRNDEPRAISYHDVCTACFVEGREVAGACGQWVR